MNRFALSLRSFWKTLTDADAATRVASALAAEPEGADLRILALLQRDGRLIDFLREDIDGFADDQIGAAVRDIHRGCRKALGEYLEIDAILDGQEGASVEVGAEFDPAAVRLLGNVSGSPPYRGVLKHHGWRVSGERVPAVPAAKDGAPVLAPAEVELP